MAINFFSLKVFQKTHTMHSKSDNIEILIGNEADKIIEELFESFLQNYQEGLERPMKESKIVFNMADLLYYKLDSPIESPKCVKDQKGTKSKKE